MTILVTGGTGFIGSHTVVELLNAGYDVVIADNLCNSKVEVIDRIQKITNKRPAFYKIDLLDSAALEKVFAENHLDAVIHFAGLKSVAESVEDPGRYLDTNLTSTFHLLNAMEKHQVYKLVFSSSATVYGTPETMPNRESDVVGKVCCPYGFSKYLNELLLHDFARQRDNFRFASLRYFNPVGAHPSGLIGEDCGQKAPNNLAPYITRTLLGQFPYLSVYGDQYDTADGDFAPASSRSLWRNPYSHIPPSSQGCSLPFRRRQSSGARRPRAGRRCGKAPSCPMPLQTRTPAAARSFPCPSPD